VTGPLALLMLVVFAAFAVEASLGFGAALVTMSFGSIVYPLDEILPAFLPPSLLLSAYIAARYRTAIDRGVLVRRILPAMLAGLPIGLFAFRSLPEAMLRRTLGAFVLALAALELFRMRRGAPASPGPLTRVQAIALLVLGGVAHGAFGTGGPLAVYVAGRELGGDKAVFRATLSALWLALNTVMIAGFAWTGRLDGASGRASIALVLPLGLGLLAGEALHSRLPMTTFKKLVFSLVGAAGAALLLRA
jgi:uncharacterized protein